MQRATPLAPQASPANIHRAAGRARYRCYLQHSHVPAETGVRPFVQLRARDAQEAARAAIHVTGAIAVVEVERLEEPLQ